MIALLVFLLIFAGLIWALVLAIKKAIRDSKEIIKIGSLRIIEDEGIVTITRMGSYPVKFDKKDLTAISYQQVHVVFIGHGTELGRIFASISTKNLLKLKQYFGV